MKKVIPLRDWKTVVRVVEARRRRIVDICDLGPGRTLQNKIVFLVVSKSSRRFHFTSSTQSPLNFSPSTPGQWLHIFNCPQNTLQVSNIYTLFNWTSRMFERRDFLVKKTKTLLGGCKAVSEGGTDSWLGMLSAVWVRHQYNVTSQKTNLENCPSANTF